MPSPTETVLMALAAGAEARRDLRRRGIDPSACERLVESLENAYAGVVAAVELGWPVAPREAHLAEIRRRLEAEPLADHPPEPPKRFSRQLLKDLAAARRERWRP